MTSKDHYRRRRGFLGASRLFYLSCPLWPVVKGGRFEGGHWNLRLVSDLML
jgi:hypothetical protein